MTFNIWCSQGQDIANSVLWYGKQSIPHVARLLLVSTYIEDGIRMWFNWESQCQYMESAWSCGWFLATAFVAINLFGQLISAVLVLCQKQVAAACYVLMAITLSQLILYRDLWSFQFLMRTLAMGGSIVLLLADSRREGRRLFAGLPSVKNQTHKPYLLLSGRLLLTLMFLTLLRFETDLLPIIHDVVGLVLAFLIAVGYKTKGASFILAGWLSVMNMYANAWWTIPSHLGSMRDFTKYYFFQTQSMTGGLLLVMALGPGGLSVDKHLKQF